MAGGNDLTKMVPKHFLTAKDGNLRTEKHPEPESNLRSEFEPTARIGIGTFVRHFVGCFGVPPLEHTRGDGEISMNLPYFGHGIVGSSDGR